MCELKSALRRELIARRRALDSDEKSAWDSDIFEQVRPMLDTASAVLTYASTGIEVDTRRLIRFCLESGIPVALPVSGETRLTFCCISRMEELKPGRFGIDEPIGGKIADTDEKSLCIVPALCADGNGFRLGYGRGYYDRFLSGFCGTSVILCYHSFRREVPHEPHDVRADLTIFNREPN